MLKEWVCSFWLLIVRCRTEKGIAKQRGPEIEDLENSAYHYCKKSCSEENTKNVAELQFDREIMHVTQRLNKPS